MRPRLENVCTAACILTKRRKRDAGIIGRTAIAKVRRPVPLLQFFLAGPVADHEPSGVFRQVRVVCRGLIDQLSIDIPADAFGLPVKGVQVIFLRCVEGKFDPRAAASLAIVEVIQLDDAGVLANELDVDLVVWFAK